MPDDIAFASVGLLALMALWRLPLLRGRRHERALWSVFAMLGAAWLMRTDVGRGLVDGLNVADLGTFLKHALTIGAMCGLLKYLAEVDRRGELAPAGPPALPRRVRVTAAVHRYAAPVAVACVLVMAVVFLFGLDRTAVPAHRVQRQFLVWHAGEPGLAVYMLLFYGCWGLVMALCAYQWGSVARHATRGLRLGLTLMATGMSVGVLYAAVRAGYSVVDAVAPPPISVTETEEAATDLLLYATFLLWIVGVLVPATQAALARHRALRDLIHLHRLWRDLALVVPEAALRAPSRLRLGRLSTPADTVRDLLSGGPSVRMRVARYVAEVHDVLQELRRHAPNDLYARALRLAHHRGHLGEQAEVVAKGYWLAAARRLVATTPGRTGALADFPVRKSKTLGEETTWLRRVTTAYVATSPATVAALLDDADLPSAA